MYGLLCANCGYQSSEHIEGIMPTSDAKKKKRGYKYTLIKCANTSDGFIYKRREYHQAIQEFFDDDNSDNIPHYMMDHLLYKKLDEEYEKSCEAEMKEKYGRPM